jgi:S-DNA-T family DNA segregation ATPase FtsK/SpoIIIE
MATTNSTDSTSLISGTTAGSEGVSGFLKRRGREIIGAALVSVAFLLAAALITHDPTDPSWNTAGPSEARNLLGYPGALISDVLSQSLGLANLALVTVLAAWGFRFMSQRPVDGLAIRIAALPLALLVLADVLAALPAPDFWPLRSGLGGFSGELLARQLIALDLVEPAYRPYVDACLGVIAVMTILWCHGVTWGEWLSFMRKLPSRVWRAVKIGGRGGQIGSRAVGAGLGATAGLARRGLEAARARREPSLGANEASPLKRTRVEEAPGEKLQPRSPAPEPATAPEKPAGPQVETQADSARSKRRAAARQESLDLAPAGEYRMPQLSLLAPPSAEVSGGPDKDTLEANARMLESVLQDFGVKGEIVKVRSGPVVTLYELEPAPGTKSSRVIGLADDIARSMSAISVRVAVVPGRNVIGIELPNANREMVYLREIFEAAGYEKSGAKLPIALGKDIGGTPVVVDLAKMPHLLIAGTTGSGKSVAVNTMILSLLYRLTPEQCRLIMVDPKMLELSIYDGIPHLLSPVVTDPKKAVVALKWAVREMETRYRAMSKLGVRNIDGYNARLAEARKKGEVLKRRVQTGFDPDTGKPVFEDEALDLTPLPYIVVVIDEVADLMLVAGKDIEGAVQRLAQMARAAGIHVIMATQRPSVDVITGTIKANFPTRISFQVTSKIDSRTILGEQGAEQLLGQGDMLHMAGGGRITRVHGPFVSDEEVEDVVLHLRAQGEPEYNDSITEEDEVGDPLAPYGLGVGDAEGGSGDELYDQAVAIVARERKASTSFIQRHLKIGYNRAATIIERMESDGVVSPANHVGKREVLVGDHSED